MLLINMVVYVSIPECQSCTLTMADGQVLEGNCTFLQKVMNPYEDFVMVDDDLYDPLYQPPPPDKQFMPFTTPDVNISVEETTTTSTPPSTTSTLFKCPDCVCTCPICTVPACPEIDCVEVEVLKDQLYNMRPDIESAAAQHGWYKFRCELQKALGDKCSMFQEGPSTTGRRFEYSVSEAEDICEDMYSFIRYEDQKGPYFNLTQSPDEKGRKRWSWNCDSGSDIQIYHL